MDRGRTTRSTSRWTRWFLALTLCLFALGYGAPTTLSAHATVPHAGMTTGCPESAGHGSEGAAKPVSAACCIAHCLPAVPGPSPGAVAFYAVGSVDVPSRDEVGEGWAPPVLLPPPRA